VWPCTACAAVNFQRVPIDRTRAELAAEITCAPPEREWFVGFTFSPTWLASSASRLGMGAWTIA
jgi:hypothetical protein